MPQAKSLAVAAQSGKKRIVRNTLGILPSCDRTILLYFQNLFTVGNGRVENCFLSFEKYSNVELVKAQILWRTVGTVRLLPLGSFYNPGGWGKVVSLPALIVLSK